MNITVQIQAPELVQAINNLAISLSGKTAPVMATAPAETAAAFAPATQMPVTPPNAILEQAPAMPLAAPTQPPVYTAPVAQPVAPIQPAAPVVPATPAAVPTVAQTYSLDQLAVAATQLVDAGRREELVGLLASFGVQALTALPKEQYGAFATQLRAMGAKI